MKISKMLGIGLLATFLVSTTACEKDNSSNDPICETAKTATLQVSNNASSPYKLYINGVLQMTIPANTITQQISINEANGVQLRAVQASGYILYATERTSTYNAVRCTNYTWQIP